MSLGSTIIKRKKAVCAIIIGAALIGAAWFLLSMRAERAFAEKYRAYAVASAAHVNAAYIPAADGNPVRRELNTALARALADTAMSETERREIAHSGLNLLKQMENEIDEIGAKGEAAEAALVDMEIKNTIAGSGIVKDIIALAKERADVIADIRGLSYRANFHTAEIFNRILEDEGALTSAHVLDLNGKIPKLEEQFNERSNQYDRLQQISRKIDVAFISMKGE